VSATVSQDFVFGTLATSELRVARLRGLAAGAWHAHDLEPLDPRPGDPILVRVTLGPDVDADHVTCYTTFDDTDPAGDRGDATTGVAIELDRAAPRWDTLAWTYVEAWSGTIPGQPAGTMVRYRFQAWTGGDRPGHWVLDAADDAGRERPGADGVGRGASFAIHVDEEAIPDWLRDAVIYQVFVDRFAGPDGAALAMPVSPGDFCGGTLAGVRARLDHIASLGVTCLWLTPIFPSPSHHGYDASDYLAVEPRMGTFEDLSALVADAHARGIRVLLDFVVNHVSSSHAAFRRAQADHEAPEARWFRFTSWPDEYETFFGVRDHPRIDSDDPGARQHLIEAARRWLDMGVDGFRCDYANGPSHAFWSAFRAATRAARPDSVTLGEVVETPALQRSYEGRLDGCLDFLLMQALRRFFAFRESTAGELDAFLRRHLAFFGDGLALPSFLDNHDMNRFLWVVGGDARRLRLAAMCQFALPGPPIVYYGTELGLSQRRDVRYADGSGHPEESRLPMPWDDADASLLAFYVELGRLRRATAGLWRRPREVVALDDGAGLYAWRCDDAAAGALVALNNGDGEVDVEVDPSAGWGVALASADDVRLAGGRLVLPPVAGAILVRGTRAATERGERRIEVR
jgi:cyclomaltodextrinase